MNDKKNNMLPAIIAGGATLLGSIFGSAQRSKGARLQARTARAINQKKLEFTEKMWNKTNRYNSPLAQRKRLAAAGLNPNLVYGSGNPVGSASTMSQPDLETPQTGAAVSALGGIGEGFGQAVREGVATSVAMARKNKIEQDTANAAVEELQKTLNLNRGRLSYKQEKALFDTIVKTQKANLANINQNIDIARQKNLREEAITDATVAKMERQVKLMKKQGKLVDKKAVLKGIDIYLWDNFGITPGSPYWAKFIPTILNRLFGKKTDKGFFGNLGEDLKDVYKWYTSDSDKRSKYMPRITPGF